LLLGGAAGVFLMIQAADRPIVIAEDRPTTEVLQAPATRAGVSQPMSPAPLPHTCGAALGATAEVAPSRPLRMTATLPNATPGKAVRGSVTLSNAGGAALRTTGARGPRLTVARDGRVVGQNSSIRSSAVIIDLEPGESRTLPLWFIAGACASASEMDTDAYARTHPLDRGRYDVYASYTMHLNGESETLVAGPFRMTIT
jgi:hypothetical protein